MWYKCNGGVVMEKDTNINEQKRMLESLMEDRELAKKFGKHIEEVEKDQSKAHHINKPEDVFKLL
jgi:hypothetical protein